MSELSRRIAGLSREQRRMLELKLKKGSASEIRRRRVPTPCLPSANQEWLWSVDRLTNGNPAWNVFTGAYLKGPLKANVIERCLNEIIKRHEILRTTLKTIDRKLTQVIAPTVEISLPIVDLKTIPVADRQAVTQRHIGERYRQVFDLSVGPLFRPTLFTLSDEEHALLVVMHHTVTDWISCMVFNRELAQLYKAFVEGVAPSLPELPIQYGDYALWEHEWMHGEGAKAQMGYWERQLAGAPELSTFPTDHERPVVRTYWGERYHFGLTPEASESLRAMSLEYGITVFMTLLTTFYVLLFQRTRKEDVILGTPVIGRQQSEFETLIGLFLNHLPLRVDLSGNPSFRDLLGRVRKTVLDGYANQELPFGRMVEELSSQADAGKTPFFQVMFFFLTVPPVQEFSNLTAHPFEAYGGTARYDVLLSLWDRPDAISGFFEYNISLFNRATIVRMAEDFRMVVGEIAKNIDQRLSELVARLDAKL